jgi:hypothetical protein
MKFDLTHFVRLCFFVALTKAGRGVYLLAVVDCRCGAAGADLSGHL